MFTFRFLYAIGTATGPFSMLSVLLPVQTATGGGLLAGSSATGIWHLLALTETEAEPVFSQQIQDPSGTYRIEDAALVSLDGEMRLYSAGKTTSWIDVQTFAPMPGVLVPLPPVAQLDGVTMAASTLAPLRLGDQTYLAAAIHDRDTIEILEVPASGAPQLVSREADGPKAKLDGVSDMVSLTRGDELFLVAAAGNRAGLTSFRVEPGGQLALVDTLGATDGLWVQGLDALATAEVAGVGYVIAGSASAGSLTVIRINDLGVMFISDQMLDDRNTRFDGVVRIETVSHLGRSFVVAGGGDGGISLLELLPGGVLLHHQSLEARDGWSGFATGVSGLSVTLRDSALDIAVAGAGGLARFWVALDGLAPPVLGSPASEQLTGGSGHDLLLGRGGNDTLQGGAGDDLLIAGAQGSFLTGGEGQDIFRLTAGTQTSRITDFEQGQDRIDLSGWGRLYDISALSISARSYGAQISFGELTVRVSQPQGGPIPIAQWGSDDFLF